MPIESRPFDYDPLTGIIETFHFDHDTGMQYLTREQDVEGILEFNKAQFNSTDERAKWGNEMVKVASLPAVVTEQLAQQGILGPGGRILDERRFRKWMDDPDNKFFRTRPGKLSR